MFLVEALINMARLYLFAEGQTEQTFANQLLLPHLTTHQVFLHKPVLIAHARKKGRVHRGGGRHYLPMKNDILRFLKQDSSSDVFFTTMIDLYAIAADFPRLKDADKYQDPVEKVNFLEQCFREDISDSRFIPYIQLHEYEAYLFANPTYFGDINPSNKRGAKALEAIAQKHDSPELINDGLHTAPSKRIIKHFPEYGTAKVIYGPLLAEKIGLSVIREQCQHFNHWLSKLESLNSANLS